MKHFTTENKEKIINKIIFCSLMIFFFAPMWLFYEWSMEPKYWKNRWRLHRLIKSGKVKVVDKKNGTSSYEREYFTLLIEDEKYYMEIWRGKEMTLTSSDMFGNSYIGLFYGSITTAWLNKQAIKNIRTLSDPQVIRDLKLRKLGIK